MNNCLVTVFLVTYNHLESIEKAILSVLEQKTTFGFKLIILDDASNDGTSDIVRNYAKKYPNIITPVIRKINIGGRNNIYYALKNIETKYYTLLEGDDYWCDENKLQLQVDALEQNSDCSFCAHNTLVKYSKSGSERLYLKCKTQKFTFPPKKIPGKGYIEPHTSSRLYRTSCLDIENIKNSIIVIYDIAVNFYFLTKGNLYYIDKVMSVYNYNEQGIYSGKSGYAQRYKSAEIVNILNREFDYKYNDILSRFFSTRINLNFCTYLKLRYFTPKNKLESSYKNILKKYKKKYLQNFDVKPIFKWSIPLGRKKRISLELKREKVRG